MTDEMNTSPTMETLLARMNEWGASITGELVEIKTGYAELRQSVAELRKGQDEQRADMNEALYRVKRQTQNLNETILEVRGDFRQLAILFEKLEAEFPPTK